MAKWRKKPVEIEAFQYDGDFVNRSGELYVPIWAHNALVGGEMFYGQIDDGPPCELFIKTLEGQMHVSVGDYIIRGVSGEFYPCKPDIFLMTYEPVATDETRGGGEG